MPDAGEERLRIGGRPPAAEEPRAIRFPLERALWRRIETQHVERPHRGIGGIARGEMALVKSFVGVDLVERGSVKTLSRK